MSQIVIVDSSALVSLSSQEDANHTRAVHIGSFFGGTKYISILPGEVFTETVNVLMKKTTVDVALETAEKLIASTKFVIIETTLALRRRATERLKQLHKTISFTDCLVMTIADEYQTKHIFTFDEHFKKNGYVRLGIDE